MWDFDLAPMGHSTGRREGNTLVIDTVRLADATVSNATGLPHADVEYNGDRAVHYRKSGGNQ